MSRLRFSPVQFKEGWRALLGVALITVMVLSIGLFSNAAYATTCDELVSNGGMESAAGWNVQTTGNYALFSDYLVRSGNQAAYFAGVDNAEDNLSRSMSLPQDSTVTLSFWWQVHTEEASSGWDGLSVLVADQTGIPQKVLFAMSDQNAGYLWQQATVDLSEFSGETIQLQFKAQTDGSLTTDFFVDDLSVSACSAADDSAQQLFLPFTRR